MTRSSARAAANCNLEAAKRLYDAFGAKDPSALLAVLTEDFRGVVCDGMPHELGGTYEGAQTMLRDCWRRVFALVDVRPVPAEYVPVADDRMIVLGHYEGTARATGTSLRAAFAHTLWFTDGRVSELVQITDTGRWRDALRPDPSQTTANV